MLNRHQVLGAPGRLPGAIVQFAQRQKQVVPSLAQGHDHATAADLQDVDLAHILGKGAALGRRTA